MSILDPWNKVLYYISSNITTSSLEEMKLLVSKTRGCRDGRFISIPQAALETIKDGRDMIKALASREPEQEKLLSLLVEILVEIGMESVSRKAEKLGKEILANTNLKPTCTTNGDYGRMISIDNHSTTTSSMETRPGPGSMTKCHLLPSDVRHHRKLMSYKCLYLQRDGSIIYSRTPPGQESDPPELTNIPQILWEEILKRSDEIDQKYQRYTTENDKSMLHILNDSFVNVSEYEEEVRIQVRRWYRGRGGALRPGKQGIALTHEQWSLFEEYLTDARERLTAWNKEML